MASFRRANYLSVAMAIFSFMLYSSSADGEVRFELPGGSSDRPTYDRIVSVTQQEAGTAHNVFVTTKISLKILREDLTILQEKNTSSNKGDENVLTILRGSEIFTCKNDVNGTCQLRDTSFLNLLSENLTGSDVIYPGGDHIMGWIDDVPGEGTVITTALSSSENSLGDLGNHPLPLISTRKFPTTSSITSTRGALPLLLDDSLVPSSYIQVSPCLPDHIYPFYGFTAGNHRFILKEHFDKRQGDREMHVKLIRLCKRDETFRSYMELPLNCRGNRCFFNQYGKEDIGLISSVAYYSIGELYISFTKKVETEQVSYVCRYNIESINKAFINRRKSCLEGKTETTEISWYRHSYCPRSTSPQFNIHRLDDPDFCYKEHTAQPLGGSNPITQHAITELIFNGIINSILVVSPTNRGETVYILGDSDGYLHKVSTNGWKKETVNVGFGIRKQNGLLLHVNRDEIYVMGEREIVKLPIYKEVKPDKSDKPHNGNTSQSTYCTSWNLVTTGALAVAIILTTKHTNW